VTLALVSISAHRFPLGFGHPDGLAAVREGTGHLRPELLGRGRELAPAVGTDEFDLVRRQLDILGCRDHEFLRALGAVHDDVEEFFACGEAGGTVRAFETEWHGLETEQVLYPSSDFHAGEKLNEAGSVVGKTSDE